VNSTVQASVCLCIVVGMAISSPVLIAQDLIEQDQPTISTVSRAKNAVGDIIRDAALIIKNVFSANSFAVIVATFPAFVIGGMCDGALQKKFYDRKHHKNLHQASEFWQGLARFGIVFPIFMSCAFSIDARNEDLKETSRLFLVGFPFVGYTRKLIKKLDVDREYCLRPWHEQFSREKRAHGGFPSGHVAIATYAAALYGMRFGPRAAIPLGAYAVFTALTFVTCNRHYISQTIAGAGLGFLFACAVSTVVDQRLNERRDFSIDANIDAQGSPVIKVAWRF